MASRSFGSESARIGEEKRLSGHVGEIVSRICDALPLRCPQPVDDATRQMLSRFCVRLVFCLYAEDAGIFGEGQFLNYLRLGTCPEAKRRMLSALFRALGMPRERRDSSDAALLAFPYVSSGLFAGAGGDAIPPLDCELCALIEGAASAGGSRAGFSPTGFVGLFESTLNPDSRRAGGMHYTSVDNIHKVIDPLFLDALKDELADILESTRGGDTARAARLRAYCRRLAGLTFLDPACGSGNFLTETYISLRRMEDEALRHLPVGRGTLGGDLPRAQVSIRQFYGIEIDDFAAAVARTALGFAAVRTQRETRDASAREPRAFPSPEYVGKIRVGNALAVDWLEHVPGHHVDYIIGNPPFSGARFMGREQKADLRRVFAGVRGAGDLDFVTCWFLRAAQLMRADPTTRTALVATNSIVQGQSVALLWRLLSAQYGMFIDFAHRTFKWTSDVDGTAAVHCVIVGMTARKPEHCTIYDETGTPHPAERINGYLADAPNIFIDKRIRPLCVAPKMVYGNLPIDGGHLLFSPDEKDAFLDKEPGAAGYFRRFMGAEELIRGRTRYCLWLVGVSPQEWANMPQVAERVRRVREFRLRSSRSKTRADADRAWLFSEIRQPNESYLAVPMVSSERRAYLPMAFFGKEVISSAAIQTIPGASLYHFGVLASAMHAAWMRAVAGRLELRYRYSAGVVYNNFPWPTPSHAQRVHIETCAQAVLTARSQYPDSSLAALYDPPIMPSDLRRAHHALDAAVDAAYDHSFADETSRVSHLFTLYQNLVQPETPSRSTIDHRYPKKPSVISHDVN